MHDELMLDAIAATVADTAPGAPDAEASERVWRAAHARVADARRGTAQRGSWAVGWRFVVAAGCLIALGALAFSAWHQQRPTTVFAKENALAAITPRPGYAIHAKTTEWAQNSGEATPVVDGTEVTEFWLDLAGDRERDITKAADGSVSSQFVLDGHRFRVRGINPVYPEQGTMVDETYGSNAGGGVLQPYDYIRSAMPAGQQVRTIALHGEPYWDVRWTNVKDSGGMTLTAHAQFRKSDYAPALIETAYPGGSSGRWTVLSWEVVPISALPTDTFSLASIPTTGGVPGERAWWASDIHKQVSYPVYWCGEKVDTATVVMGPSSAADDSKEVPLFIQQIGFRSKINEVLGSSCALAEYTADDPKPSLSVLTGPPMSRETLVAKLAALADRHGIVPAMSTIGAGESVTLSDGSLLAGFALPGATVLVHAGASGPLAEALTSLARVP